MATIYTQAARERTTGSRGALDEAFQQIMQGLSHIQEAFHQQERRSEERLSKIERMFREATAEQERKLQRERQKMEATVASIVEEAKKNATFAFGNQLRKVEARLEALERQSPPSGGKKKDQTSKVDKRLAQLERRMENLEASTDRALQSVLPRVEELLNQHERPSPLGASSHATSTSTSGAASASASSAPRPHSPPAGSAAPPPLTPERREELGEELKQAAEYGREADVQRLLDSGADINSPDANGWTPLMWAAYRSRRNVVADLIGRGADIAARTTNGVTALHYACLNDYSGQCASLLIRAGAPVQCANHKGRTPLHFAAQAMGGNMEAARALLAAGASRVARDSDGHTPWDSAESSALRRLLLP